MFSNTRLKDIFQIIMHHTYTPIEELEEKFHVTGRTIRADLSNLNEELAPFCCEIKLKRKHGYYIDIQDEDKYKQLKKR